MRRPLQIALSMTLAACLAAAVPTAARSVTVEELLRTCRVYEKAADGGVATLAEAVEAEQCRAYIAGYYDGWTGARLYIDWVPVIDNPDLNFCVPPTAELTYLQLVRIFIRWADQHPERHHHEDFQGVRAAFSDVFPCNN